MAFDKTVEYKRTSPLPFAGSAAIFAAPFQRARHPRSQGGERLHLRLV